MIRLANTNDTDILCLHDRHISRAELEYSINRGRVYIAETDGRFAGWLRYNLFWDNTPFMNLLYVLEEFQGSGFGKKLTEVWEYDMKKQGFDTVMTSTQADEYAQHFYTHLGYSAVGGFTPFGEVHELIFMKKV